MKVKGHFQLEGRKETHQPVCHVALPESLKDLPSARLQPELSTFSSCYYFLNKLKKSFISSVSPAGCSGPQKQITNVISAMIQLSHKTLDGLINSLPRLSRPIHVASAE